jgi:bifunctional aspartokinase / homoserine dehydrogenase 1
MPYKVIKFGGSNLQRSTDYKRCAEIVLKYNRPCVVVVSAFYQVTDRLKKAAMEAADSGHFPETFLRELSDICFGQVRSNVKGEERILQTNQELKLLLDRLGLLFRGIHAISELPAHIHDTILSYGERISALVMKATLSSYEQDVSLALPEEFGLITDGEHGVASILLRESSAGAVKYFVEDRHYVVPGFYGISAEGKTTLLGRGGTDYSAAALAYLLDADSLDVWKDVEGFKTGDPRLVKDPRTIDYLCYSEAAELSYFGAKILHPRTVEPLQLKNIPVRIFNIDDPSDRPGTVIHVDTGEQLHGPRSITYSRNFSVIKLKGAGVGFKPGVLARVAGVMDNAGVNISSVFTSQTAICFLLQGTDLKKAKKAIKADAPSLISDVETISDIALVALVGEGITKKEGIAAKAFQAVAEENINIEIIAAGASTAAVYFVVKESDCDRSVIATHRYFFPECRKNNKNQHSDLTSVIL